MSGYNAQRRAQLQKQQTEIQYEIDKMDAEDRRAKMMTELEEHYDRLYDLQTEISYLVGVESDLLNRIDALENEKDT